MKKRAIFNIVGVVVLIGGISVSAFLYQTNISTKNASATSEKSATNTSDLETETRTNGITYQGKDGSTALAILVQNAKIVTSGTGEMAFVTTINNVKADSKTEFWAYTVNGADATVGAGSYVTTGTDTIIWKLTKF